MFMEKFLAIMGIFLYALLTLGCACVGFHFALESLEDDRSWVYAAAFWLLTAILFSAGLALILN